MDDSDIEYLQDELDDGEDEMDYSTPVLNEATNSTLATVEESNAGNGDESEFENASDAVDKLSGSAKFTTNEVKDRYYETYDVGIRAAIVDCLIAWNTSRPFCTVIYDKRFIGVLLKEVFGDELAEECLCSNRLEFVKFVFEHRVDDDVSRSNTFNSIVAEKREKAQSRGRANAFNG